MNEQASAWLTAVEGLAEVHERLKRVVILCDKAINVIRAQDGSATLFYCDPPYLLETRSVKDHYRHEMTTDEHRAMLTALSQISGRFLLSGYRNDLYDSFAVQHAWRREDVEVANQMSGAKEKDKRVECVWMNY